MANNDDRFTLKPLENNISEFTWTIVYSRSNFSPEVKEFKIGTCNVEWKLAASPRCSPHIEPYLMIGFCGTDSGVHSGTLNWKAEQISTNFSFPTKKQVGTGVVNFTETDDSMKLQEIKFQNLFSNIIKEEIFLTGTITIFNCKCQKLENKKRIHEENINALKQDIQTPLQNKRFTDLIIKVDEATFPVHKFILRARSPVFDTMFEQDMKESRDSCITITDTNETVMENFINFLYCGSLEDDSFATVLGLYSLADKYQVTSLQKTCRKLLVPDISDSTVLEILKISDLHIDEELKEEAAQFISRHFSTIALDPEWSSLITSNPRLASYVLQYVTAKYSHNSSNISFETVSSVSIKEEKPLPKIITVAKAH